MTAPRYVELRLTALEARALSRAAGEALDALSWEELRRDLFLDDAKAARAALRALRKLDRSIDHGANP